MWCCAVVFCCLLVVLFVFAFSFAVSGGAVLPCHAVLLGCAVCCPLLCVSLLLSKTPAEKKTKPNVYFLQRKLYTTQHTHTGTLCAVLSTVPFPCALCSALLRCAV